MAAALHTTFEGHPIYDERCSRQQRFRDLGFPGTGSRSHAPPMFYVDEAQAAVIRTAFEQRGELSAVVELRRLFPGVDNIALAREDVRTIAGWRPLLARMSAAKRSSRLLPGLP